MDVRSLTKEEKVGLYRKVAQMARGLTASPAEAEEIVQQTFLLLYTTRAWRPDGPPFHVHLWGVLRSVCHNQRKTDRRRKQREAPFADESTSLTDEKGDESLEDPSPGEPPPEDASPEESLRNAAKREAQADRIDSIVRELRERLADKPLDLAILDRRLEGIMKREELVAATGQPMEAVKHSLARIRRYAEAIFTERGLDWVRVLHWEDDQ